MPGRLTNVRQEAFCHEIAKGLSQAAAYRKIFKTKGLAAESCASRLMATDKVRQRVQEIRAAFQRREEAGTFLTMAEKRGYCAKKVRDPNTKISDALKAIELDSKISGELTDKIEQTGNLLQDGRVVVSLPEIIYTPRIKPTP